MASLSEQLIEALEPWRTEDLEHLCRAIGAMGFDAILELCGEDGSQGEAGWLPAWGRLFDVELCPAKDLPYLAQYVGVEIPTGAGEEEARALVREEPAFKRGSTTAIERQIYKTTKLEQTTQSLVERGVLIERRNAEGLEDAYRFGVAVDAALIPSLPALEAAVNAVKPGGVRPWYQTGGRYTWSEATGKWEADSMTWSDTKAMKP